MIIVLNGRFFMKSIKFALLCLSVAIFHSISAESLWRSLCNNRVSSFSKIVRFCTPKGSKLSDGMNNYSGFYGERVQAPNPIDQDWVMVKKEVLGTDVPFDDEETCKWVKESWAVPCVEYKGKKLFVGFGLGTSSNHWALINRPKPESFCVVPTHEMALSDL